MGGCSFAMRGLVGRRNLSVRVEIVTDVQTKLGRFSLESCENPPSAYLKQDGLRKDYDVTIMLHP
jgi:hypothetical protein